MNGSWEPFTEGEFFRAVWLHDDDGTRCSRIYPGRPLGDMWFACTEHGVGTEVCVRRVHLAHIRPMINAENVGWPTEETGR